MIAEHRIGCREREALLSRPDLAVGEALRSVRPSRPDVWDFRRSPCVSGSWMRLALA
jgi:hypothetical protein